MTFSLTCVHMYNLIKCVHSTFALIIFIDDAWLILVIRNNFIGQMQSGDEYDSTVWFGHVRGHAHILLEAEDAALNRSASM